ncbi:hypothetical protein Tco_0914404 [Tanacetum coccineum]
MAALKFASSHNMVAFLDIPTESDGFEQIVDFLNAHPIKYALKIQALVDKKKVIIIETSLTLMGSLAIMKSKGKDFSGRDTPLFPTMIVQAQEQSRRKKRKDTEDPQLSGPTEPITDDTENVASVPTHSNDPLLSGEDRLKLNELMELCTKLSERVLALETTKTNQALEIDSLKRRVKTLEKKKRVQNIKGSYNIQSWYDDNLMFDTGVFDNEQDMAEKEDDMVEKDVSTSDPVTIAGEVVTNTKTTVDELTLARTLIKSKQLKPRLLQLVVTQDPS